VDCFFRISGVVALSYGCQNLKKNKKGIVIDTEGMIVHLLALEANEI